MFTSVRLNVQYSTVKGATIVYMLGHGNEKQYGRTLYKHTMYSSTWSHTPPTDKWDQGPLQPMNHTQRPVRCKGQGFDEELNAP